MFLLLFSFSGILETYKTASLVPAEKTKEQLHQSLNSHTEAKLDSIDISLLCPLTRSRMGTPIRGRNCTHIHCFDGEAYLQLMWEKHVEKWKCPVSYRNTQFVKCNTCSSWGGCNQSFFRLVTQSSTPTNLCWNKLYIPSLCLLRLADHV